jgi:hypothetical protein
MHLVSDEATAERLARAAITRQALDTSAYDLERPETVEKTTVNKQDLWRVAFARKQQLKGDKLIVLIDADSGESLIGWGE